METAAGLHLQQAPTGGSCFAMQVQPEWDVLMCGTQSIREPLYVRSCHPSTPATAPVLTASPMTQQARHGRGGAAATLSVYMQSGRRTSCCRSIGSSLTYSRGLPRCCCQVGRRRHVLLSVSVSSRLCQLPPNMLWADTLMLCGMMWVTGSAAWCPMLT